MGLLTIGHGPDTREQLGARLTGAGIRLVVDVRRFPGSRVHPDVAMDALATWLPDLGIGYRWEERLGGRRRLPAGEPAEDRWWKVAQFAAYAAHTRTAEFTDALDGVLSDAAAEQVAVMCNEYLWWRCHRRLIADVAVLADRVAVRHVMPDGRLAEHRPAAGAEVGRDGLVRWPG
ncbi:MAG TPA: DUF488 domain-containing protein [Mycobacteriales bacterium]|nr:DUF488 domain-containing protein [Mycobacteriales bacterium]